MVLKRDKSGFSEIFYALRMGEKAEGKSPFENLHGRKSNTVKSYMVHKIKGVSKVDPGLKFTMSSFEEEIDSAIMARERPKGSKLEGQLRKKAGKVIKETAHTITFLPKGGGGLLQTGRGEDKAAHEKCETPKRRSSWAVQLMGEMEESSEDQT